MRRSLRRGARALAAVELLVAVSLEPLAPLARVVSSSNLVLRCRRRWTTSTRLLSRPPTWRGRMPAGASSSTADCVPANCAARELYAAPLHHRPS